MNISTLHQSDGGPSRGALSIAIELAQMGNKVEIVAFRVPNEPVPQEYEIAREVGVEITEVEKKRLGRFRFSFRIAWACWKGSSSADVISSHGFYQFNCIAASVAARLRGAQLLVQPHGVFEPYQESIGARRKRLFMRVVGNWILNSADAILVASGQERDGLSQSTKAKADKIVVTGLGVAQNANPTTPDFRSRRVLFLSRVAPKKRLDLLIEACRLAEESGDPFSVDVCGSGDPHHVDHLKTLAKDLPITFHGLTSGERRASIESAASIFCLPSDNENFGQAVTEAMAAGLPVVTTSTTGASEHVAIAGAGWVLTAPSADSLSAALRNALSDPDRLDAMGRAGRAHVRSSLTWTRVAEKWISLTVK